MMKTVPALVVVLAAAFSVAQAAKYTHIENVDCHGHDIESMFPDRTESQCKALCNPRSNCKSFQLNNENDCYLKDYACNHEELKSTTRGNMYIKESWLIHWLRDLSDNDKIKDLAIPGSHDTGSYRLILNIGECHDWDVQQQLSGGLRFLDIRLSNGGGDNDFEVRHGDLRLGSFRTKVMEVVTNFLRNYPHEAIFMSIKPEDSFDVSRMEDLFVKNSDFRFYQGLVTANTKLGDVRGKIVLIKRYGQTSYSNSIGINWDQLHVQDSYELGGSVFNINYEAKAAIVTNHFQNAAANDLGKIWVNFASANWHGSYIGNNAEVANAAVKSFYQGTNQRVGSIVPMDYPNRASGVIEAIIDNNNR